MNVALEKKSLDRLRAFEPPDGYYLCYSGGKDSDVIKILASLSGVKFTAHHNLTTVDFPETVNYIKSQKDVEIHYPAMSMWRLIEHKKIPPTRVMRYCCSELKEKGGHGKLKITGVRWAESSNRLHNSDLIKVIGKPRTVEKTAIEYGVNYKRNKSGGILLNHDNDENRRLVEHCYRTTSTMVNPIVDWSDNDVYEFLKYYGCSMNPLYSCGFSRVGCIGCPMAGNARYTEFRLYPKYRENYVRAFNRMIDNRIASGLNPLWENGEACMRWWLGENPNQLTFVDIGYDF